jgi:hypothetical protein
VISARTRALLIAATVLSGLLASGNVDHAIVALPAWEQVGAPAAHIMLSVGHLSDPASLRQAFDRHLSRHWVLAAAAQRSNIA